MIGREVRTFTGTGTGVPDEPTRGPVRGGVLDGTTTGESLKGRPSSSGVGPDEWEESTRTYRPLDRPDRSDLPHVRCTRSGFDGRSRGRHRVLPTGTMTRDIGRGRREGTGTEGQK